MGGRDARRPAMAHQRELMHIGVEVDHVEGRRRLEHHVHHDGVPDQRVRFVRSSRRPRGTTETRWAEVIESPPANKVTSCPISTRASVRYETTRSVPPYARGGTLSYNGATWAIFKVSPLVGVRRGTVRSKIALRIEGSLDGTAVGRRVITTTQMNVSHPCPKHGGRAAAVDVELADGSAKSSPRQQYLAAGSASPSSGRQLRYPGGACSGGAVVSRSTPLISAPKINVVALIYRNTSVATTPAKLP